MLDRIKLLNRLRAIWFRKRRITPEMVVDTMKALYEFITGKAALCLLLILSIGGQSSLASGYSLSGPRASTQYSLSPKRSESKPHGNVPGKRSPAPSKAKPNKIVVVSATWCQPCKRMYPIVERLKAEGYDAEVVYDYDGPSNITAYPTILFLRGDKVIYKNVGVTAERTIRRNLEKPDAR
jgi:thiol-disulfide isomerase/thioredoxin